MGVPQGSVWGPLMFVLFCADIADAVQAAGGKVSAFFVESGMSVAGVIVLPMERPSGPRS